MTRAVIAGGTSGIGLSIARALMEDASTELFIIGRSAEKGAAAESSLNAGGRGKASFIQLDLSDIAAVRHFARGFRAEHEQLDVLAHIAGIMDAERHVTDEGFERTFAIGYLSAFVLGTELAPLLEATPHSRIVHVAGEVPFIMKARVDFDDLSFSRKFGSFKAAITTVHAKTVLTELLAAKYPKIDVNSFHPGAIRSDLMNDMPFWIRLPLKLPSMFMKTSCDNGIRACRSEELRGTTGKFLLAKGAIDLAFDAAYKERLWAETEQLLARV